MGGPMPPAPASFGLSSRFMTLLAIALATSAGLLAVVAVAAAGSGSNGLSALASVGAMIASAAGYATWKAAVRVAAHHDQLQRSIREAESSRRAFRQAVAQLGSVARLRDTRETAAGSAQGGQTAERGPDEILRVVDSIQLTAGYKVATPANWKQGEDVVILPAVSDDDARKAFPSGWKAMKPYLRIVAQPGAGA